MYWSTLGGGEKYLGELASALANLYDVELLTIDPLFDLNQLSRKLSVDVSRVKLKFIPVSDESYLSHYTSDYDVLINGTYRSRLQSRAKLSILVVWFPENLHPTCVFPHSPEYYVMGVYEPHRGSLGTRVTGSFKMVIRGLRFSQIRVTFSDQSNIDEVLYSGQSLKVAQSGQQLSITLDPGPRTEPIELYFRGRDEKEMFVRKVEEKVNFGFYRKIEFQDIEGVHTPYQHLISISSYTSKYIELRWRRRDPHLLFPPIDQFQPDIKTSKIVSVGRFFRGDHSKKQHILIEAFKLLHTSHPDIELILIGGLSNQPDAQEYAKELVRKASGLPVKFLFNADRSEVIHQYATSKVYWHATGFGEDLEKFPDHAEHFGIAPVEAMSAGCIPLIYDSGGVDDYILERSKMVWNTVQQLVELTAFYFSNEGELRDLAGKCQVAAKKFQLSTFKETALRIINDIVSEGKL